jgi:hypothetical protein
MQRFLGFGLWALGFGLRALGFGRKVGGDGMCGVDDAASDCRISSFSPSRNYRGRGVGELLQESIEVRTAIISPLFPLDSALSARFRPPPDPYGPSCISTPLSARFPIALESPWPIHIDGRGHRLGPTPTLRIYAYPICIASISSIYTAVPFPIRTPCAHLV